MRKCGTRCELGCTAPGPICREWHIALHAKKSLSRRINSSCSSYQRIAFRVRPKDTTTSHNSSEDGRPDHLLSTARAAVVPIAMTMIEYLDSHGVRPALLGNMCGHLTCIIHQHASAFLMKRKKSSEEDSCLGRSKSKARHN